MRQRTKTIVFSIVFLTMIFGSGIANAVDNPDPILNSISPDATPVGSGQMTMTLTGSNFIATSSVKFNGVGTGITTSFNPNFPSQLTATIPSNYFAIAGFFDITVFNPGPGGGTSDPIVFTVTSLTNPVPVINNISHSSRTVGTPGFEVTITGTNFMSPSQEGGNPVSTLEINGTQVQTGYSLDSSTIITLGAALIGNLPAGAHFITVTNPPPGGGTSNGVLFLVNSLPPVLDSINPPSVSVNSNTLTMTVTGDHFVDTASVKSEVRFNGVTKNTSFIYERELQAVIPFDDLDTIGTFDITVFTPAPGGGTSSPRTFTVTEAAPSSLTVIKTTNGYDATFDFDGGSLGTFSIPTSGGYGSRTFSNITPGSYTITELTPPANWTQNPPTTCSVTISTGEDESCSFSNTYTPPAPGNLVIIKETEGGDGAFSYAISEGTVVTVTTSGGSGTSSAISLSPGLYNIIESVPAGWQFLSAACTGGSTSSSPSIVFAITSGQTTTCTFRNIKSASLTVIKTTNGYDATFDFDGGSLGTFSIPTSGGYGSRTFSNITPGSYTITELTPPANWTQNPPTTCSVTISTGEDESCSFSNTYTPPAPGNLVIIKETTGGDGTFTYSIFPGAALVDVTTSGGTGTSSPLSLGPSQIPGDYAVYETAPGWNYDSVSCTGGFVQTSYGANVSIVSGETNTCTFHNTKQASLTVIKTTNGYDATFDFDGGSLGTFSIPTSGGYGSRTFSNITPGSYTITELTPPANWTQNPPTTCSVTISTGEDESCSFSNTYTPPAPGNLVIIKETTGGDGTFTYSIFPGAALVDVTTSGGTGTSGPISLSSGPYTVTELVPVGWQFDSAICDSDFAPAAFGVGITIVPDETITCTFHDTKQSTLTVIKTTNGYDGTFTFTGDLGNFPIPTSGGQGSSFFSGLTPGTYSISEVPPGGNWQETSSTCTSVAVAAYEDATCTVVNTYIPPAPGNLVIIKETMGGDGAFGYTISSTPYAATITTSGGSGTTSPFTLDAGDYAIFESLPAGWNYDSVSCTGGFVQTSYGANVTIVSGETNTCTFHNTKQASLTVIKTTNGYDATFDFDGGSLGTFSIPTSGGYGSRTFSNITPGSYTITELTPPANWTQNPPTTCSVTVSTGEDESCSFSNTYTPPAPGNLVINKQTTGGNESFDYFIFPNPLFINVTTLGGVGASSPVSLSPGTYSLVEIIPALWDLDSVSCTGGFTPGQSGGNVVIASGETNTCTFHNIKRGSISVTKTASGLDGNFNFTTTAGSSFSILTSGSTGSHTIPNVVPGTHSITESVPAGWQSSGTCTSLTVAPGGTASCSFANIVIGSNPVPTLTSATPSSRDVGDPAAAVTLAGTNFMDGGVGAASFIQLNGFNVDSQYYTINEPSQIILSAELIGTLGAGAHFITVNNPGPGGGTSNGLLFLVYSQPPVLNIINPNTKQVNSPAFVMTLTGENFVNSSPTIRSLVRFSGATKNTRYLSETLLEADIPAEDLDTAGTFDVTVFTPAPGGGTSLAKVFRVTSINNPVPRITSINPNVKTVGDPDFIMTFTGTGFNATSFVLIDGIISLPTTYNPLTQQLTVEIDMDSIPSGHFYMTVNNPPPGGGTSNSVEFTVHALDNAFPTASGLSVASDACPDVPATGMAFFSWTYADADRHPQTRFDFQVDDDENFDDPQDPLIVDARCMISEGCTPTFNQRQLALSAVESSTSLYYNKTYYWRVRVWDDRPSESAYATSEYTTFDHPGPYAAFSFTSTNQPPAPKELITFVNESRCYGDGPGIPVVPCQQVSGTDLYTWDFGDGTPPDHTLSPGHAYLSASDEDGYEVELTVEDEIAQCSIGHPVKVDEVTDRPVQIKEISPLE